MYKYADIEILVLTSKQRELLRVRCNWFAGQKLRHRRREQTYGHQGGKAAAGWGWWRDELGDWG